MKRIAYLSVFVLFINTSNILSQQVYTAVPEGSSMKIEGTSTLHDWDMTVEKFNCNVDLILGNPSTTIENVNFTGISEAISSHSSLMDNKSHDALKTSKYPEIRFSMSSPLKVESKGNTFSGTASGKLFIAGKYKIVSLPFTGKRTSDNTITITGSKQIDMTEFGIDPPTAMFGTLKTGKDVTVTFKLNLKEVNGELNASLK